MLSTSAAIWRVPGVQRNWQRPVTMSRSGPKNAEGALLRFSGCKNGFGDDFSSAGPPWSTAGEVFCSA